MAVARETSCGASAPGLSWPVVLWDFDGTLADTAQDVWASLEYAARRLGASLPEDVDRTGESLALPMRELFSLLTPAVDPARLEDFDAAVTRHYRMLSSHVHTGFYPGIRELLVDLRAGGAACHIVTNKPRPALERILSLKGWGELFDGWVSSDSGGGEALTKAQMIKLILGSEGTAPGACVMVGDSAGDIEGARAAGVASVGVTYGDGAVENLLAAAPDFVADDAGELRDILLRGKKC